MSKIGAVLAALDAFADRGVQPCLGLSGNIGQAAIALGHAADYSVGVGVLERINYAATMNRQANPRPTAEEGLPRASRLLLREPRSTVNGRVAAALFSQPDLRLRVGCRIENCRTTIDGPLLDPRGHYLHVRAHDMAELLGQPERWRATRELDRLRRAVEVRTLINQRYRQPGVPVFKTRTLNSLIAGIEVKQSARTA